MKILIVEDDKKISEFLAKGLKEAGYLIEHASDGEEGLAKAVGLSFDLVILDLMLPKLSGLDLLQKIRSQKIMAPVLILSAKHSVDDRVSGLQSGGDDYMVKPFAFTELLARVEALLRRSPKSLDVSKLQFEDLVLDLKTKEVTRSNKRIELHAKEFSLLEYFLRNPGQVLSKTQILEKVWSYDFDPQTNVVDVLVCRLRNKIDKDFDDKTIHTIRGMGYVLKKD
ncbi:MAG TPA: response regulator transcription factor [Bdellovibrio sp.]|uniref:response regulator transcription factor n=1 Tax=Bdellovibrio sp. TaxID=28201 RepID=UPI002EE681FF